MSDKLEATLSQLELGVRRLVGRRHATEVAAELRDHLEESVRDSMATGPTREEAEEKAVSSLGSVDPKQYVPADGAPRWFDRRKRQVIVKWVIVLTLVIPWILFIAVDKSFAWAIPGTVSILVAIFFAIGFYGMRHIVLSILKTSIVVSFVCAVVTSFFLVADYNSSNPYLRLRSDVAELVTVKTKHAKSRSAKHEMTMRQYRYYLSQDTTPEGARAIVQPTMGHFEYPLVFRDTSHRQNWWKLSTDDFELAKRQWRKDGLVLVNAIKESESSSRIWLNNNLATLNQPYDLTLKITFMNCDTLLAAFLIVTLASGLLGNIVSASVTGARRMIDRMRPA